MPGWVHSTADNASALRCQGWGLFVLRTRRVAPVVRGSRSSGACPAQGGKQHRCWKPYSKSYDEMAATDPMARSEFVGIVEQMLRAANEARPST